MEEGMEMNFTAFLFFFLIVLRKTKGTTNVEFLQQKKKKKNPHKRIACMITARRKKGDIVEHTLGWLH